MRVSCNDLYVTNHQKLVGSMGRFTKFLREMRVSCDDLYATNHQQLVDNKSLSLSRTV